MFIVAATVTQALQNALHEVQESIKVKTRQRDQLNAEIAQLQATRIGLQRALGQQVQAEIAWTELVLAVLNKNPGQPMSAVQIREVLQSWGYSFAQIQNPLAFLNTCLQRLAQHGRVARSEQGRPFRFSCE
jgi:hypothetical protein